MLGDNLKIEQGVISMAVNYANTLLLVSWAKKQLHGHVAIGRMVQVMKLLLRKVQVA